MSYQNCPYCKGRGKVPQETMGEKECHVCKGFGIINELTGLPPKKPVEIKPNPFEHPKPKVTEVDSERAKEQSRKFIQDILRQAEGERKKTDPYTYETYHPMYGKFGPVIVGLRGDDGRKIVGLYINDNIV